MVQAAHFTVWISSPSHLLSASGDLDGKIQNADSQQLISWISRQSH